MDDNVLMHFVSNDDKEAYNKIVLNNMLGGISFAYSFIKDEYISEDIVQDVFINIYINRKSYVPKYAFKTYLYKCIRNKCIDYLRKSKKEILIENQEFYKNIEENTVEEDILYKEKIKEIYNIINTLQDTYKTALYLYSIENMDYKQIANIMKKTVAQVKVIIFRARKKLKNAIDKEDSDEK